jgi:hypothetical protein
MFLTASIVTYNTSTEELRLCLESLYNNHVDYIYIVDNSPQNNLGTFLNSLPFKDIIEYIPSHDNPGYGAAHNIAIRRAFTQSATYHLVINADVYFQATCLSQLTDYLNRHPETGQIQPRILSPDGSDQYSSRLLPSPLNLFGRRFLPKRLMQRINRRYLLVNRPLDTPLNIPYHQGSFMLFRTDTLKQVGLFDERFFMYPEDIDITRRVHQYFTTIYFPTVTITHAHHASSYHSFKMLRIHTVNMIRYFNKWGWLIDSQRKQFNRATLAQLTKQNL